MDIPRDRREVRREKRRRLILRSLPPVLAMSLLLGAIVLASGRDEPAPISVAAPLPPALPDSVWNARINDWAADAVPLTSLLVSWRDTLIIEHYAPGVTPHTRVNVKSVSKSVLSALVGLAFEQGHLDSLGQTVADILPEYFTAETDPGKREITIGHLLTMSSGLEGTSFGNYDAWIASRNWVRYALDRPLLNEPGRRMVYSTGNTHLLSVILTRATGMSTLAFGRRHLFEPMGIAMPAWDRDPQGYYLGGNNMHFTPREMLSFGRLYLDGGSYRGKQLLSPEWVSASLAPTVGRPGRSGYGYLWWYRRIWGYDVHYASGYGGQYIVLVPGLDLVVVMTTSLTNRPRGTPRPPVFSLLSTRVLPAVRDRLRHEENARLAVAARLVPVAPPDETILGPYLAALADTVR